MAAQRFEYRTNLRQRYNHPNIVVPVASDLGAGFDWILSYFEGEVAAGVVFSDNQLVQVGWMMVKLCQDSRGDLEVLEPGFDSVPINWTRGASTTIRHLMLQRETCAQLGVEPVFPVLSQSGVVSADFFGSSKFHMERELCDVATDSGWLFKDPEPTGGRHCSLFEIAVARPEVVAFLALPFGAVVSYDKSGIEISVGDRRISFGTNEFIARLLG
ncbi:hypothetical protein ABXT21_12270 [Ralstonia sp. SM1864_UCD524_TZ4]|uniref:Imm33-like domain-containing protein n=1 Tax=Ralstonia solanacearum TaxID=305 RepID=A0A0S4VST8_RALSL|nr:hypothetical protein [Ralstonia pseudosolanacearum]CUV24069.1 conserved protein of unknown function [Ralstonia solanacearum]CUV37633.1 conserved protein of unknown function [Ralstonia solanacearum]CUV38855.1 conserved protein of unknown function [Ralstonia solanacearum]CUV62794.1 conserved protein of unknown function [Ralstonia solanacearum]